MKAYYNDNDRRAAAWLRELVAAGLLPQGDVDERSICDVAANDLLGYSECHFFAGIGGWPYALRLAEWPAGRQVWTGSVPCQPWSIAGKRRNGFEDERHLWPEFHRLIAQCRPATVFGEQVASSFALPWLDTISHDLEGTGYAFGAANLCACAVGAPHVRQRLYWVADTAFGHAGNASPCRNARNGGAKRGRSLRRLPRTGWNTPSVTDGKGGYHGGRYVNGKLTHNRLDQTAQLAMDNAPGRTLNGSSAKTEGKGQLAPAFSRWLMGYPDVWDCCGATAMQSCRRLHPNS